MCLRGSGTFLPWLRNHWVSCGGAFPSAPERRDVGPKSADFYMALLAMTKCSGGRCAVSLPAASDASDDEASCSHTGGLEWVGRTRAECLPCNGG